MSTREFLISYQEQKLEPQKYRRKLRRNLKGLGLVGLVYGVIGFEIYVSMSYVFLEKEGVRAERMLSFCIFVLLSLLLVWSHLQAMTLNPGELLYVVQSIEQPSKKLQKLLFEREVLHDQFLKRKKDRDSVR